MTEVVLAQWKMGYRKAMRIDVTLFWVITIHLREKSI
jgi:hypothetical protein